jgi:hypothetical protein
LLPGRVKGVSAPQALLQEENKGNGQVRQKPVH